MGSPLQPIDFERWTPCPAEIGCREEGRRFTTENTEDTERDGCPLRGLGAGLPSGLCDLCGFPFERWTPCQAGNDRRFVRRGAPAWAPCTRHDGGPGTTTSRRPCEGQSNSSDAFHAQRE